MYLGVCARLTIGSVGSFNRFFYLVLVIISWNRLFQSSLFELIRVYGVFLRPAGVSSQY